MSDYTVHDYQWLKDMHIELAQSEIEISPAELLVLSDMSDQAVYEREKQELLSEKMQAGAEIMSLKETLESKENEIKAYQTDRWILICLFVWALVATAAAIHYAKGM